jgi:aryl-alcohol dehydrogenase-like predicted oxidoreductase
MRERERPLWPGRAAPAASLERARRFGMDPRPLGRTGLHVAPVGFGGYRVHVESALHRQAIEEALRAGVNLVDTSANYGDGGSEIVIGQVLRELFEGRVLSREDVVVVTKAGYLQGTALELAHERQPPYPDVVRYQTSCWHCIHPEFLADQLELSRQRLGLQTIDVFLLHNPEYFLIDRENRAGEVDAEDRAELERRMREAFAFLEQAVLRGEIGWYGVSSNSFVEPPDSPRHLSLGRTLALAREVGGALHHFAVAELPLNLYELGAVSEPQEDGAASPLALARREGLATLTNRPLNAFVSGDEGPQLIRLADAPGPKDQPRDPRPILRALQRLEAGWSEGLGARLAGEYGDGIRELLRWGTELEAGLEQIRDLGHWLHLRNNVISAHVAQIEGSLTAALDDALLPEFRLFWDDYGQQLLAALDAIEDDFRARAQALTDAIGDRLAAATPEAWRGLPLSRRAVLTLLALPVTCVLVGMRRPAYVHDMTALGVVRPKPGVGAGKVDVDALVAAFRRRAQH